MLFDKIFDVFSNDLDPYANLFLFFTEEKIMPGLIT